MVISALENCRLVRVKASLDPCGDVTIALTIKFESHDAIILGSGSGRVKRTLQSGNVISEGAHSTFERRESGAQHFLQTVPMLEKFKAGMERVLVAPAHLPQE